MPSCIKIPPLNTEI